MADSRTSQAAIHVRPPQGTIIACESDRGRYALDLFAGRYVLAADEPASVGGADTGSTPYELLSAALAACTTMTLRMYASRKGWELGRIHVAVRHAKVHAEDCAHCEDKSARIDRFDCVIEVEGELPPEQQEKLLEIAAKCPVHRTLKGEIDIRTRVLPMKAA